MWLKFIISSVSIEVPCFPNQANTKVHLLYYDEFIISKNIKASLFLVEIILVDEINFGLHGPKEPVGANWVSAFYFCVSKVALFQNFKNTETKPIVTSIRPTFEKK